MNAVEDDKQTDRKPQWLQNLPNETVNVYINHTIILTTTLVPQVIDKINVHLIPLKYRYT